MAGAIASRRATTWTARPHERWRTLDGSAVLADLSGFTRLTEALAGTGPEGVEVLHRALTTCFSALLDHSLELDGDVIGFAGDAALVWFDGVAHAERAARAAAAMPRDLAAIPSSMTGRVKLRASVGLHTGEFVFVRSESGGRSGLFLCGPAMSTLARLEAAAEPMQALMSAHTAEALPPSWRGEARPPGIVLERRAVRASRARGIASPDDATPVGEHRVASMGFVLAPGTDALLASAGPDALAERIQRITEIVVRVADEHAVSWLDVDVGEDCVKFLLAAGVPRAVDDDDARLVSALRRILDESPVPLRAGAQRGRVFSGLLGVRTRRTFTALGDAVNVAARAMGRARDGELVAADGLGVGRHPWIRTEPMGPQQLKNRVVPMGMWRVLAVDERPRIPLRRHRSTASLFRRVESERLAAVWKATVDGTGASVCLVGEPGMGASELIAELVDLAGGGATSLLADRFAQHVPYSGVHALVRSLATGTGRHDARDGRRDRGRDGGRDGGRDDSWAWLATAVPLLDDGLREWAPAALAMVAGTAAPTLDPRTAARRARQVLVALVRAVAPRPWLLAVEDADHLDDVSRHVVDDLCELAAGDSYLVVTSVDREALRPGATVTIELEPLDDGTATAALLEIAPHLRDDQVARVIAAGGGNPLVLVELLAHSDDDDLPDTLQRLGATLVDSLPAPARTLVLEASVIGTRIDAGVAAAVLQRTEPDLEAAWRSAAPIVRSVDSTTWRFRHEAYRRAAYETLTFRRRRELHGAIADHLRARTERPDALVALHLLAAGREREAYPVALTAAFTAKTSGALVEAVDLFARAVAIARRLDPADVGRLSIELGEARLWTGDVDGATAAYTAAARATTDPAQLARLCHLRADLALSRHQFRPARRWIDRGTTITARLGGHVADVRVHLLLHEAVLLDLQGRHAAALVLAEQALDLATHLADPGLVGLAHLQLEAIRFALAQPEALQHGAAAIEIFTAVGDDRLLDRALSNSGLFAMYLGRWDAAAELYERARRHAERCGHAADAAMIDLNAGFLRYRQGHLVEAEQLARSSRRSLAAVHADIGVAYTTLLLAMIAARTDRVDDALVWLAEARAGFASLGSEAMVVDCDVVGLELTARRGDPGQAVRDAAGIEPRLAAAEVEVAVSFARVLGSAEAAVGATGDGRRGERGVQPGVPRIRGALERARELHLRYEEHLCLRALAEATGDPVVVEEHAALARDLGIVGFDRA